MKQIKLFLEFEDMKRKLGTKKHINDLFKFKDASEAWRDIYAMCWSGTRGPPIDDPQYFIK